MTDDRSLEPTLGARVTLVDQPNHRGRVVWVGKSIRWWYKSFTVRWEHPRRYLQRGYQAKDLRVLAERT